MRALFVPRWNSIGPPMERDSPTHGIRANQRAGRAGVRALVALGLCAVLGGAGAAGPTGPTGSIFSCTVNGKTFTADRVPAECANSDVREMNRDGSVRRVIARPLTVDEQR